MTFFSAPDNAKYGENVHTTLILFYAIFMYVCISVYMFFATFKKKNISTSKKRKKNVILKCCSIAFDFLICVYIFLGINLIMNL